MKKILLSLACLVVTVGTAFAVTEVALDNGSVALRIRSLTSDTTVFNVTSNGAGMNMTVTVGARTNVINGLISNTVATLKVALEGATNAAGNQVIACDSSCALSADSTDGELLAGSYTLTNQSAWTPVYFDSGLAGNWGVDTIGGRLTYIWGVVEGSAGGSLTNQNSAVAVYDAGGVIWKGSAVTNAVGFWEEDFGGMGSGLDTKGKVLIRVTPTGNALSTGGYVGAVCR